MKRGKVFLIAIGAVVLILAGPYINMGIKSLINKDIVAGLEGKIYYSKRDDGVLTLYKSDANLKNEILIYSHKGKGKTGFDDYNDNIIDFHYDQASNEISFRAMNDGDFTWFSMKEGQAPLETKGRLHQSDYIKRHHGSQSVTQRRGSIYLVENGKETCVKRFYGFYDDKFTGHRPIGFSPDGKYLIYSFGFHPTFIGSIAHGIINDSSSAIYIMDLETGKSARYGDAYSIEWLMDMN